jgi:HD-like signal output (HDOD) protein
MFNWFGKTRRGTSSAAPATSPHQHPSDPQTTLSPSFDDPALTLPVALYESALTVPADLETLDRLRARSEATYSNLAWLLDVPAPQAHTALSATESDLLQRLDAQLAPRTLPANLLPRAAAVVPQLLGLLRRDETPRAEVARQVAKDVLLTAEVFRVARSAAYGMRKVERLEGALDRIGDAGLKQAMARVLFKPVFQAPAGGLIATISPRLWLYAEVKSALCAELTDTPEQRLTAFLAGLMHDTGWIALLRLLERTRRPIPHTFGSSFDSALAQRKDHLFGRLTADWNLTPELTALAQEMMAPATGASASGATMSALARVLREADRLCLTHLADAPEDRRIEQ